MPHSRRFVRSWRSSLPISLRGSSLDERDAGGHLVGRHALAAPRAATLRHRSWRPASSTTNAHGTSPSRSSGTPATAASRTPGYSRRCSSTSSGKTFSPPRLIIELTRPSIHTKPSSSIRREVTGAQPAVVGEPIAERGRVDGRRRRRIEPASSPSSHAHLDAGVRTADRAELGRAELLPVGGAPSDHLTAELGLAVAVEDRRRRTGRGTRARASATAAPTRCGRSATARAT